MFFTKFRSSFTTSLSWSKLAGRIFNFQAHSCYVLFHAHTNPGVAIASWNKFKYLTIQHGSCINWYIPANYKWKGHESCRRVANETMMKMTVSGGVLKSGSGFNRNTWFLITEVKRLSVMVVHYRTSKNINVPGKNIIWWECILLVTLLHQATLEANNE